MGESAFFGLRDIDVHAPPNVEVALALLAEHGAGAKVLAGGQSLLVLLRMGLISPKCLISLQHIPGLKLIAASAGEGTRLGAAITQHQLANDLQIRSRFPALAEAAAAVASPQVRRLGTIGGNLCHADPTADPPAALIALGAEVEIQSVEGRRRLPVEELFVDYMETALSPDELLTSIHLPAAAPRSGSAYLKHRLRGVDTALVGVGVGLSLEEDGVTCRSVRIGLAGAGVTPIRAREAESALIGKSVTEATFADAGVAAAAECSPLEDTEASEWYRREMIDLFVRRAGLVALSRTNA
jgi:carbon-monoxide dehydrogenase medium subunit